MADFISDTAGRTIRIYSRCGSPGDDKETTRQDHADGKAVCAFRSYKRCRRQSSIGHLFWGRKYEKTPNENWSKIYFVGSLARSDGWRVVSIMHTRSPHPHTHTHTHTHAHAYMGLNVLAANISGEIIDALRQSHTVSPATRKNMNRVPRQRSECSLD